MAHEPLNVLGDTYKPLISAAETAGSYSLFDIICKPGGGTPPHVHAKEDEAFFILEGHLTFHRDGQAIQAGPGDNVHALRNVPHWFSNDTKSDVRMLVYVTPGGIEAMFKAIAALPPGPPDMAALAELTAKYGITLL